MNYNLKRIRSGKRVPQEARIIGANVRRLRLAAGLTQREIAAALGITYQQIQKYEIGQNRFPVEKLHDLKLFYNVPYEVFFGGLNPGMEGGIDLSLCGLMGELKDRALKHKIEKVIRIFLE